MKDLLIELRNKFDLSFGATPFLKKNKIHNGQQHLMSIVKVHTKVKHLTRNKGMMMENKPHQDSAEMDISHLTMKWVTSHLNHMPMKMRATKNSPIDNILDRTESNEDGNEENDCYMTTPQSKNLFQ